MLLFFYIASIFLSAFLLFFLQPMVGKMFLPWVGGAPTIWNVCMFFFQLLLMTAYSYAHVAIKTLSLKMHLIVHFILMFAALFFLPKPFFGGGFTPDSPVLWLLGQLAVMVAIPFFVVASSAPIVQKWFTYTEHSRAHNPFFLYAASNLGSILALLLYPFYVEPSLNLSQQTSLWSMGYLILIALFIGSALFVKMPEPEPESEPELEIETELNKNEIATEDTQQEHQQSPVVPEGNEESEESEESEEAEEEPLPETFESNKYLVIKTVLLGFIPSSLLLGVTQLITRDIAPIPMLWVLPLMLYLLTFVIAFSDIFAHSVKLMQKLAFLSLVFFYPICFFSFIDNNRIAVIAHLLIFFFISLFCHKTMYDSRPEAKYLTSFYQWVSFAGLLGGFFNSIVAPYIFTGAYEYPIVMTLASIFICRNKLRQTEATRVKLLLSGFYGFLISAFFALIYATFIWFIFNLPLSDYTIKFSSYFMINHNSSIVSELLDVFQRYGTLVRYLIYFISAAFSLDYLSKKSYFRFSIFTGTLFAMLLIISIASLNNIVYRVRSFFGIKEVHVENYGSVNKLIHGSTIHGAQSMNSDWEPIPLTYFHPAGPLGDIFNGPLGDIENLKVGIIGLGAGSIAAYNMPGWQMDFYEIDPDIVDIVLDLDLFTYYQNSLGSTTIYLGDGRIELAKAPDSYYDIIILDAFSSDHIPTHLLTTEAVELYLTKLSKDGLILFHISNRYLNLAPLCRTLAKQHNLISLTSVDESFDKLEPNNWYRYLSSYVVASKTDKYFPIIDEDFEIHWSSITDETPFPLWTDNYSTIIPCLLF